MGQSQSSICNVSWICNSTAIATLPVVGASTVAAVNATATASATAAVAVTGPSLSLQTQIHTSFVNMGRGGAKVSLTCS